LAERLLKNETLSLPDIVEIMGERPFPMKESVAEYLSELKARQEVDAYLNEAEKKLAEENEKKKKEQSEKLKFDVDAAEKDEQAAKKEEEATENKDKEKRD
jgi:hypothetical protein